MPEINDEEYRYCFCHPCLTSKRQEELRNGAPPHTRNSAIRKTKYKKCWTIILQRHAWNHPRYQAKKDSPDSGGTVWVAFVPDTTNAGSAMGLWWLLTSAGHCDCVSGWDFFRILRPRAGVSGNCRRPVVVRLMTFVSHWMYDGLKYMKFHSAL